jgi:hypothetical protein
VSAQYKSSDTIEVDQIEYIVALKYQMFTGVQHNISILKLFELQE